MKRMALTSGVLVMALTASAVFQVSAKASAQTGSPKAGPTTTLQTGTSLVVVPALVQTTAKELVFSLTADDFTLTDNGVPQKVTLEADSARPLSLVVLMQTGGAARSHFKNYENLEAMLAAVFGGTPNQVSIVSFDSRIEGASPFTSDIAQWSDALNHPDPGNSGAAIYDGLDYALDLLKQQPANTRRAILLISQEYDDGSQTKLKDIIRTVGETDTAVYSLTFSAEKTNLKEDFKRAGPPNKPITVGDQQYVQYFQFAPALSLAIGAMRQNLSAEVADLSGGEANSFDNKTELDQDLGILSNHLRNSYILSFTPTPRKPGLHTIQVRLVHRPDLLVTARTNYWSEESPKTALPK
jgi:VWFA-related protein